MKKLITIFTLLAVLTINAADTLNTVPVEVFRAKSSVFLPDSNKYEDVTLEVAVKKDGSLRLQYTAAYKNFTVHMSSEALHERMHKADQWATVALGKAKGKKVTKQLLGEIPIKVEMQGSSIFYATFKTGTTFISTGHECLLVLTIKEVPTDNKFIDIKKNLLIFEAEHIKELATILTRKNLEKAWKDAQQERATTGDLFK